MHQVFGLSQSLTDCAVTIESDITKSEVRFELPINVNQRQSTSSDVDDVGKTLSEQVLTLIGVNANMSIAEIAKATNQSKSSIDRTISALKKTGKLIRVGSARSGKWKVL